MTSAAALGCAALVIGGLVQSATGFGFALVAAPVLIAIYAPARAIPTLALVGILVSLLIFCGEGRRPRPLAGTAAVLSLTAIPGTLLGALILTLASAQALRVLVAIAVIVAVAVHLAHPTRGGAGSGVRGTVLAGGLAGALGATTGLSGPPLVLLLLRRGVDADRMRYTLTACFIALDVLLIATLALAGEMRPVAATPLLLAAAVLGQLAGRRLRRAVVPHHERVSLAVLVFSGAVALASALGVLP